GSAGRPLSPGARRARHRRRQGSQAGALQVRRQKAESRISEVRPTSSVFISSTSMPRRRETPKREILPDPKYVNTDVAKVITELMSRGKKSVDERNVYDSY